MSLLFLFPNTHLPVAHLSLPPPTLERSYFWVARMPCLERPH